MKLVIIFGPHAVGKMTVGQALARQTDLRLFHNHMTIDIVLDLFRDNPEELGRLTNMFRREIFESFSKSQAYGMIFTYMWGFDLQEDWAYIDWLENLFRSRGAEVYFVELEADYDVRIERNKSENRLLHKPSKRNLEQSERLFRTLEAQHRLNSLPGEIQKEHYLRINNTNLAPEDVARQICETFNL